MLNREYYGGEDGANPEDYPESYDDVPTDGGADYGAPDEADADTIGFGGIRGLCG